jgi:hypothetical protein
VGPRETPVGRQERRGERLGEGDEDRVSHRQSIAHAPRPVDEIQVWIPLEVELYEVAHRTIGLVQGHVPRFHESAERSDHLDIEEMRRG